MNREELLKIVTPLSPKLEKQIQEIYKKYELQNTLIKKDQSTLNMLFMKALIESCELITKELMELNLIQRLPMEVLTLPFIKTFIRIEENDVPSIQEKSLSLTEKLVEFIERVNNIEVKSG
jgi:hypothetical protein